MPDLTGLTALDIAVGLFFLFFVLSIVCSTINELVASFLGMRAKNLQVALRQILEDKSRLDAFWDNPRIRALSQPAKDAALGRVPVAEAPPVPDKRKPSYIPARTFALTALDTLAPDLARRAREDDAKAGGSRDVIEQMRGMLTAIPSNSIQVVLNDALDEGRTSIDELRRDLEQHFDTVMDRASGWYKRKAQRNLLIIAAVVTIAGNVDTVQVASKLWKDDALRASVVTQAVGTTAEGQAPATEADLEKLASDIDRVGELGLPLGWNEAGTPSTFWGWVGKLLLGWPATILALSMGSAFWFDVLGKVARLRVAGRPNGTVIDDTGRKAGTTGSATKA